LTGCRPPAAGLHAMAGYGAFFFACIGDTGSSTRSQPRSGRQEVSFASDAIVMRRGGIPVERGHL